MLSTQEKEGVQIQHKSMYKTFSLQTNNKLQSPTRSSKITSMPINHQRQIAKRPPIKNFVMKVTNKKRTQEKKNHRRNKGLYCLLLFNSLFAFFFFSLSSSSSSMHFKYIFLPFFFLSDIFPTLSINVFKVSPVEKKGEEMNKNHIPVIFRSGIRHSGFISIRKHILRLHYEPENNIQVTLST